MGSRRRYREDVSLRAVGGAKYIKALKGPFPHIEMIPTGGVNLETAADFLKAGACAVAVGGELVDAKTIKEGRSRLSKSAPANTLRSSVKRAMS